MVENVKEEKKAAACIAAFSPSAPNCSKKVAIAGCRKIKGMARNPAARLHRQISGSITRLAKGPTVENRLKEERAIGAVARLATSETIRPAASQLTIFSLVEG